MAGRPPPPANAYQPEDWEVKPPEVFRARLSRLLHLTRAQEAAPGERVLAPGDLEQEAERDRLDRGIPLSEGEAAFFERIEAESL